MIISVFSRGSADRSRSRWKTGKATPFVGLPASTGITADAARRSPHRDINALAGGQDFS
jgi:hypothetical protein